MGSVLTRDNHKMNKDGTTHFTMAVPSLTIGGTKDGLLRISRVAESWYHQRENIEKAQDGCTPSSLLRVSLTCNSALELLLRKFVITISTPKLPKPLPIRRLPAP